MTPLIGLYSRTWLDRYEDEFLALLAERRPDQLDRLDIVRGTVDARLQSQVDGAPAVPSRRSIADAGRPLRAG